jgi:hypothetical protein
MEVVKLFISTEMFKFFFSIKGVYSSSKHFVEMVALNEQPLSSAWTLIEFQ